MDAMHENIIVALEGAVAEHVGVLLADEDGEVEVRTMRLDGLTRVFLRRPGGAWLSRYAWSRATVEDLVRRFLEVGSG